MKRSSTVAHRSVDALLAGWFAITLVSQHPHRSFDWFRQFDRMGAIPNWRFFAPFPIRYDFVVLFRVVSEGGEVSPWTRLVGGDGRSWSAVVWSPERRHEKAVLTVCGDLVSTLTVSGPEAIENSVPDRVLRELVRREVLHGSRASRDPAQRCQFLITKSGGYDDQVAPKFLYASPLFSSRSQN
ncbi:MULTISPECIES: hypothetical protein [unclassified Streptomyces]|uniref:hypothetical protein n=1 Tax=unclassified Streptomyces TaxID=2593676 RepID=UPI0036630DC6